MFLSQIVLKRGLPFAIPLQPEDSEDLLLPRAKRQAAIDSVYGSCTLTGFSGGSRYRQCWRTIRHHNGQCSWENPAFLPGRIRVELVIMAFLDHSPIASSPTVLGGALVFAGTRVPVQTLVDYLNDGFTLNQFLEFFPSVARSDAEEFFRILGNQQK